MECVYGWGGWVRFREAKSVYVTYLRFARDGSVADLFIDGGSREVTPALLRQLPLARYQARALARPDLLFGGLFTAPVPELRGILSTELFSHGQRTVDSRSRVTLQPPVDVVLTDGFLQDVARAYQNAVAHGERPNVALANQSGHPKRTIERWVYQARKRGLLPPAPQAKTR